jgi:hypothetical protein
VRGAEGPELVASLSGLTSAREGEHEERVTLFGELPTGEA